MLNSCNKLPTNRRNVTYINFAADNIAKVIANFNSNNAHLNDNLSISLIKICGHTICKPLELISKHTINNIAFPPELTKGNIVSCYKKWGKKTLKITVEFLYFLYAERGLKD